MFNRIPLSEIKVPPEKMPMYTVKLKCKNQRSKVLFQNEEASLLSYLPPVILYDFFNFLHK